MFTTIMDWLTGRHPMPMEEGPSALARAAQAIEARRSEAATASTERATSDGSIHASGESGRLSRC